METRKVFGINKKMKVLIVLSIVILILIGCGKSKSKQVAVYSFSGENNQFIISNGVIVLSPEENVFYGGDLKVKEDFSDNIVSFSTRFYDYVEETENTILSSSVIDQSGGSISLEGDLGKISGESAILGTSDNELDNLKNNLFLEITITNKNGEECVYQIQMSVREVTILSES